MDAPRNPAERDVCGHPAEYDVQRISGRVWDAGDVRGGDEQAVVFKHHGARR